MHPLFVLLVVSLMATPTFAQSVKRSLAKGFEQMKTDEYHGDHTYSRVKFDDGTRAERFILRSGDCYEETRDCSRDRERIEYWNDDSRIKIGDEVWYTWSIYIPEGSWIPPRHGPFTTLGQFKQFGPGDELGPPIIQFYYMSVGYRFELSNPLSPEGNGVELAVNLIDPKVMQGKWTKIMMQAKWSNNSDGFINVWVNDELKVAHSGANSYHANKRFRMRYGVYRFKVSKCGTACPEQIVYYSNIRRGKTLAAVSK
ncbi:MAG: heparin lyase I family protein [Pseudomonadota bacterium]